MNMRVKELREKRHLTQSGLALKVGATQQTISKVENGICIPKVDLVIQIAEVFNVSIDYLLGLSNSVRSIESQLFINSRIEKHYDIVVSFDKLSETNKETVRIIISRLLETQSEDK